MIFDAGGVRLEGKDEARDADAEGVKEAHLNRGIGVFNRDEDEEDGEDSGVGVFAEEEGGGALEIVDGLATFVNDRWNRGEVVV